MRERTREELVIMKSNVAKHYGCKRVRPCGLIANGRSQANRDFFLCRKYELLLRSLRSKYTANAVAALLVDHTLFCRAVNSILSQRLLHKMTNSRQFS